MKKLSFVRVRLFFALFIYIILMALSTSCMMHGKMDMTDRGPGNVWLKNDGFSPAVISVPVNTTVTWTNKDFWPHTVTSDDGLFDSGKLRSHKTFSYKFTRPGIYAYHCNIHKMMIAKVMVK